MIVPSRWTTVDIKLLARKHCFYWHIYNGVVREITEVQSIEEKCPRCVVSEDGYRCRTCSFSRYLL